jgi:cytochrome c oxidase assembly protein subunit 11
MGRSTWIGVDVVKTTVLITTSIAIVMFGFSFLLSPLYNKFCKVTGINTTLTENEFYQQQDQARKITVQFVATNNRNLPWEFFPRTQSIVVHPNEKIQIVFHAKNLTGHVMNVQAIASFTPIQATSHFHKIECFCFTRQTLNAGETKEMPVVFKIDRELPKNIHTITLAYTLFKDVQDEKNISN